MLDLPLIGQQLSQREGHAFRHEEDSDEDAEPIMRGQLDQGHR